MQAAPPGLSYSALACDSDGIDGTEDNAGAFLDSTSRQRAGQLGLDIEGFRARNDTYGLFEGLGDLIRTGPTGTNVNDLRIILMDHT
jgi:hydroxypyruvate reductase